MESSKEVAGRWRERAQELRIIAATMDNPTATQDLLDLALRWDLEAKRAEERAKLIVFRQAS